VNSFGHRNGESLAQLIMRLEDIKGLEILRYTSSHPKDVSDELIAVHGSSKKLSRHLHLPVQSGSNTVLERMFREYTVEHYLGLLEKLRKARPDIILTSDIICGFPNESQEEHEETMELLRKAQFDSIYSYAYSSRPGTRAAKLEDNLTDDIRNKRLQEVQALQLDIQAKIRELLVGTTQRILVEGKSTKHGLTKWKGRTNCLRIVHFEAPKELPAEEDLQWHWVDVRITSTTRLSCQGELVTDYGRNPHLKQTSSHIH
jgi:tRNA-2-methylthio-N6-dimethylallyladenosine synthase